MPSSFSGRRHDQKKKRGSLILGALFFLVLTTGCARLFGWNIHAPGILSEAFAGQMTRPAPIRIGLYFKPGTLSYLSTQRGDAFADPMNFFVGEAFGPMMIEGLQGGFQEFVFMETEPTAEIMRRYGIAYLAYVRIKAFSNKMNVKGQAVSLTTESVLFDRELNPLVKFESSGTSDAKKVFKRKGGPEVNLNAAIERNVFAVVQYIQDYIRMGGSRGSGV